MENSQNKIEKIGVLLVNVGTPDFPTTASVRKYLNQFLSDPRVLDIPALGRWLLLKGIILPFRSPKSAAAYRKIWTLKGSPLLQFSLVFCEKLKNVLPVNYQVEMGMRYGNPSIGSALKKLNAHELDHLILFPLYPQYSSAATGTSIEEVAQELRQCWNIPAVHTIPPFYNQEGFIQSFAANAEIALAKEKPDHILFSYHGLPERHIRKSECETNFCLKADNSCCESIRAENSHCYRAQCFDTTRRMATSLNLSPTSYSTAFQSRLGRTPWIKPYTDEVLVALAKQGAKKLLVICPAFVADCLETLEEITIRARDSFIEAGGEDLVLLPSLNADDKWVNAAKDLVLKTIC